MAVKREDIPAVGEAMYEQMRAEMEGHPMGANGGD